MSRNAVASTKSAESFKVSFNLPARRLFFSDDGIKGIMIHLDDDKILFRPTTTLEPVSAVRMRERTRGGFESVISGTMAAHLFSVLTQTATPTRPFFILSHSNKSPGWIELRHFSHDCAPSKSQAHLRVWMPRDREEHLPLEDSAVVKRFVALITASQETIAGHVRDRKLGRPSREIMMARETMKVFEKLAIDMLPHLFISKVKAISTLSLCNDLEDVIGSLSLDTPSATRKPPAQKRGAKLIRPDFGKNSNSKKIARKPNSNRASLQAAARTSTRLANNRVHR